MTSDALLLQPFDLGPLRLGNRAVMAPLTRNRAHGNVPNDLMVEYYAQRAGAGLIVTEGTAPSPNGQGYARMPGLFTNAQIEGWKKVTAAVHERGGKIVVQLMHTGRVSHPANLPAGTGALAPSAVPLVEKTLRVDAANASLPIPVARAMTDAEVRTAIDEYAQAARNAIDAGFDGIELHGANGYLIEQFLNPHTNRRDDAWGGDVERRLRFPVEVARATAAAIGGERVGIRLSPYGTASEMPYYSEVDTTYERLATAMGGAGLLYVHLVDHSTYGAPAVPVRLRDTVRSAFGGPVVLCGGYDFGRAESDLRAGHCDLVAFGRPFLANPDLVERFARAAALNDPDVGTFYTDGAQGYTDYPALADHTPDS